MPPDEKGQGKEQHRYYEENKNQAKNEEFLKYIQKDPYYFYEKARLEKINRFGNKEYEQLPN